MFSIKRPLSVIISLLMLFTVCAFASADEAETVAFTLTAPEAVMPGETFTVAFDIGGADYEAHSLFFTVKYDPSVISYVSIAPGPVWNELPMDCARVINPRDPGLFNVGILCPTDPFAGHGTLMYITFTADAPFEDGLELTLTVADFFFSPIDGEVVYLPHQEAGCTVVIADEPALIPGDVDGDGQVTFLDISTLYLFLTGEGSIDEAYIPNADFNGDGTPTYADITDMYLMLLG